MLLAKVFECFVERAPIAVAARVLFEAALNPRALDALFDRVADRQYFHQLLFSTCVDLMGLVVCRAHGSLNAAYQAASEEVGVSLKALYEKVAHVEPATSAALARHTAERLEPVIDALNGRSAPLLPGYRIRILDGNHLGKSERRLKPLRNVAAGPLPGQTLAVLDPESGLIIDVACCEDGHAQERSYVDRILEKVRPGELWIADRNFCTTGGCFGIDAKGGKFLIRQHASTLTYEEVGERRAAGRCKTGQLFEQKLKLRHPDGRVLMVRRITVVLDEPTRDGETEIHLLTNLTKAEAKAKKIAMLYLKRWGIERAFLTLTTVLKCEVNTLGYPRAALFGFCVAVAAYNIYAAVKGALRGAHGAERVEAEVSDHFLADEIARVTPGMELAVPATHWRPYADMDSASLAKVLLDLARRVDLKRYKKSPRGPKKPKPRRTRFAKSKHISTARLLANEKPRK